MVGFIELLIADKIWVGFTRVMPRPQGSAGRLPFDRCTASILRFGQGLQLLDLQFDCLFSFENGKLI